MTPADRLSLREGRILALRMFGVGVILGPVAFGTAFTALIYASAVAAGENPISRLILFPFGWLMAITFAGLPAAILTAVMVAYRYFVAPWTVGRLAAIILPLTWALASYFVWQMDGGQSLNAEMIGVAMASGLYLAILVFCVILFLWALRHRLGLSQLSAARSVTEKAVEI